MKDKKIDKQIARFATAEQQIYVIVKDLIDRTEAMAQELWAEVENIPEGKLSLNDQIRLEDQITRLMNAIESFATDLEAGLTNLFGKEEDGESEPLGAA